jgi:hypothetical protein
MKKILLILLIGVFASSCSEDCKKEYNVYKKIPSRDAKTLIISEDTCIDGDVNFDEIVRINGNTTLTILGDVVFESTVIFTGEGTIKTEGSFIASGNVFFIGQGNIVSGAGLVITQHAVDQNDYDIAGYLTYCNFISVGTFDDGLMAIQDCNVEIECETLSVTDISGYQYLGTQTLDCDISQDGYKFISKD